MEVVEEEDDDDDDGADEKPQGSAPRCGRLCVRVRSCCPGYRSKVTLSAIVIALFSYNTIVTATLRLIHCVTVPGTPSSKKVCVVCKLPLY